jgi:uncharacterized protein (UPF0335 family)
MPDPLTFFNVLMTFGLVIGGLVAYRRGFAQTVNEVQERVINALQHEIQTLHDRIGVLERENTRLDQAITVICSSLKRRGIHITVEGDVVSIRDRMDENYREEVHAADSPASSYESASGEIEPSNTRGKRRGRRRAVAQGEA